MLRGERVYVYLALELERLRPPEHKLPGKY
jgi:hypothetical protein